MPRPIRRQIRTALRQPLDQVKTAPKEILRKASCGWLRTADNHLAEAAGGGMTGTENAHSVRVAPPGLHFGMQLSETEKRV
jgi:hypothetical protein